MRLSVLGCYGSEAPGKNLSGFLVNDDLLLDAGTIGSSLSLQEQLKIDYILITHYHLDHIKGLPFFVDNIFNQRNEPVRIYSIKEVIEGLKRHLLNDHLWPDFTQIPHSPKPIIKLHQAPENKWSNIGGYSFMPVRSNHIVPSAGYIVIEKEKNDAIAYMGDSMPSDQFWLTINKAFLGSAAITLKAIIVEVSLPNKMQELAIASKHFTPSMLEKELEKLKLKDVLVFIYHMKPKYMSEITEELKAIRSDYEIHILEEKVYYL